MGPIKPLGFWQVYARADSEWQDHALQFGYLAFLAASRAFIWSKPPAIPFHVLEEGVRQGNCLIFFDAGGRPAGYLMWAYPTKPVPCSRLHPSDWNEGDTRVLIDGFLLPGQGRRALRQLRANPQFSDWRTLSLRDLLASMPDSFLFGPGLGHNPNEPRRMGWLEHLRDHMNVNSFRAVGYAAHIRCRCKATRAVTWRQLVTHVAVYAARKSIKVYFNADGKPVGYVASQDLTPREVRALVEGFFAPSLTNDPGAAHRWLLELVSLPGHAKNIACDHGRDLLKAHGNFRYCRQRWQTRVFKEVDATSFSAQRLLQAPRHAKWKCGNESCEVCD
jgi:hemolysin-activating ACP:hemolysin acyltransferase